MTVAFPIVLVLAAQAAAEPPDRDARLGQMGRGAARYTVTVGGEPADLRPEPLLRWTNPIRKTADGAVYLWTRDGRPAAALCVYVTARGLDHEWQSLSEGRAAATYPGGADWTPDGPGLAFRPLPEAPEPAETAIGRLVQMRALARRFSATVNRPPEAQEVRLLPQPVYRYPEGTPGAVDGAAFAFVQGTDPEVLLLFEVRVEGGRKAWHHAFARMSGNHLECRDGDAVAWSVENTWPGEPTSAYVTFLYRQPLVEE